MRPARPIQLFRSSTKIIEEGTKCGKVKGAISIIGMRNDYDNLEL